MTDHVQGIGVPPATTRGDEGVETVLSGLAVSGGIAIGPLHPIDTGQFGIPEYDLAVRDVETETARFDTAIVRAQREVRVLRRKQRNMPAGAAEELGYILDAYMQMLSGSRLVRGARARIESKRQNAEAAMRDEMDQIARSFEAIADSYLAARAEDVREVGWRVIRILTEDRRNPFTTIPKGAILVAESFSPADTARMDPRKVAGFASVLGGAQGHTAILARSLGLPAILGVSDMSRYAETGVSAILDGMEGRLILNPTPDTLRRFKERAQELTKERRRLAALRDKPAQTVDGETISLAANVDLPGEADVARVAGADGIGLLRTEFMFMNRDSIPDEAAQVEQLSDIVAKMEGRPVTIRTIDLGGEKMAEALGDTLDGATNPALGLRAIRLSLKKPKLLEAQLCAILRAGAVGPVRVLLPMVTTPGEVRQVREAMKKMAKRLKRRGVPFADPLPPLGVMIEVPGAALAADALAKVSDFFAIGTNDLTMYTLAIDRADEQVAHLYNPLHPAVLRLIEFAVQAALRARIPVSVCGEIAGDPFYTALLLGLGVRDLSMSAPSLPKVKQRIRALELSAAEARARMVMESTDTGRIKILLDDLNPMNG